MTSIVDNKLYHGILAILARHYSIVCISACIAGADGWKPACFLFFFLIKYNEQNPSMNYEINPQAWKKTGTISKGCFPTEKTE